MAHADASATGHVFLRQLQFLAASLDVLRQQAQGRGGVTTLRSHPIMFAEPRPMRHGTRNAAYTPCMIRPSRSHGGPVILRIVASVVAGVAAALFPIVAQAQSETGTSVGIVSVPNSPVALTACKIQNTQNHPDAFNGNIVLVNRTKHAMADARIVLVAYDGENVRMDQQARRLVLGEALASGDTTSARVYFAFNVPGRQSLLSRVTCKIQGATFSGNRVWSVGQNWPEKLLPLQSESVTTTAGGGGGGAAAPRPVASIQRASIVVTNSWNDVVNGVTFVHVALSLSAGDAPAVVRPADVQLTMSLANGLQKTYTALAKGAPTYQKLNPLGSTSTTAYEVTPSEDFGRIGTVTVPAHGEGRVVATFAIADALANPADNRAVSLK